MKLNSLLMTLVIAVFLDGSSVAFAGIQPTKPNAKQLASAPTIVIGKITALSHVGKGELFSQLYPKRPYSQTLEVNIHEASIVVSHTLKGKIANQNFVLANLLKPINKLNILGLQIPEPDKSWVFFLAPDKDASKWKGVWPSEFALEIDVLPQFKNESKLSTADKLRLIAKANVKEGTDAVATKWINFLAEQYDAKQDLPFFLKAKDDSRQEIQGRALAILCEHYPKEASLYEHACEFLRKTRQSKAREIGRSRWSVAQQLFHVLSKQKDKDVNEELKSWLADKDRLFQDAALKAIRDKRIRSLRDEVVDAMLRYENLDQQYECLITLSVLGNRSGPGYRDFMKSPKKYVADFSKMKVKKTKYKKLKGEAKGYSE